MPIWESVADMRSISSRVNTGVVLVCLLFGVAAAAIGVAGIVAVRTSAALGSTIAGDELATATVTTRLGREVDRAYTIAQAMLFSADPGRRAVLAGALYDPVVPAVDAALADLTRIHSDDSADELADLSLLSDQWRTARVYSTRPDSRTRSSRRRTGRPGLVQPLTPWTITLIG